MLRFQASQFAAFRKQMMAEKLARRLADSGDGVLLERGSGELLAKDARGHTRRIGFDGQGFIKEIVSPRGRRWTLTNTPEGRLAKMVAPSGLSLSFDYTPEGLPSLIRQGDVPRLSIQYDAQGNPSRFTHPDRTVTSFDWAAPGLPRSVNDRSGNSTRFEYDPDWRLKSFMDAEGRRTSFDYDPAGLLAAIHHPGGTREDFTHAEGERVQRRRTGDGPATEVIRDAKGRPTLVRYADGNTLVFEYDAKGRVVSASNREGVVALEYNERGSPTLERFGEQELRYEYDAGGLLSAMVLPSGERVEYGHDEDMRLCSVRDWNGGDYSLRHVPGDKILQTRAPNGLTTRLQKSAEGRTQTVDIRPDHFPSAVFHRAYEHDAEGRVTRVSTPTSTTAYQYDAEGQLLSADSTDPRCCERFAYDRVGNRTRVNGEEAEFNAANQLLRQGKDSFDYDARGNLILIQDARGTWQLEYDARDLLTRVRGPSGVDVAFGYDAFGRRVWKRSTNREVRYLWAGENLIREECLEGTTHTVRDYLFLPGTHTPLAMRVNGRTYSFHTDQLGTPLYVSDQFGRKIWSATYTAFGYAFSEGELDQPWRLPGQYYDQETGFSYNRFRYYHAGLGRYLSRDPLSFLGGLNLYLYAHNDPINGTDPLGLWSWSGVASVVAGVAAAVAVVVLAPVAAPMLAVAGAAMAVGAAVGFGLNRALEGGSFCLQCFLKGALEGLLIAGAAILAIALLPEALAVVVGAALMLVGTAGLVGLAVNWSDMSNEQKDEALGGLFVGTILGLAGLRQVRPAPGRTPAPVPETPPVKPPAVEPPPPVAEPPVPKSGSTSANRKGTEVHSQRAEARRESGQWDDVDTKIKGSDGKPIEVSKRVDLRTGEARGKMMTAEPDAVSYKRGQILDDKPLGRPLSKDRQQIIRYIKAYEEKTGTLPKQILIERYDPVTGQAVRTEIYDPKIFLPK